MSIKIRGSTGRRANEARPVDHDQRPADSGDCQLEPEKEFFENLRLSADSIPSVFVARFGKSLDVGFEVVEHPIGLGAPYDQDAVVFASRKQCDFGQ